jgi:hypothetical protein
MESPYPTIGETGKNGKNVSPLSSQISCYADISSSLERGAIGRILSV